MSFFYSISFFVRGTKKMRERMIRLILFFLVTCIVTLSAGNQNTHNWQTTPLKTVKPMKSNQLTQQQRNVNGMVADQSGRPLPGVTVVAVGTTIGTITNSDGSFTLTIPIDVDTLQFSFIGTRTQKIFIEEKKPLMVVMEEHTAEIEEVVVIGYGSVQKKDLTGSVGQVNVEDLKKAPVPSFDQALSGRIAGVQVASNDGQPGSSMNIVVRGGNSLTQSTAPLYVVDGFPIDNLNKNSINPDDIASITILKDASATAIYGSMGANGVVIIETKSGVPGKLDLSYHGYLGEQSVIKTLDMMNPYEFVKYQLERDNSMTHRYLQERSMSLEDYQNVAAVDWQKHLFKPAFMQNHAISLRGGSQQTQYSASISYFDQNGIASNSGYNRIQSRISIKQKVNDKLTVEFNANFAEDMNYGALTSQQGSTANSFSTYMMYQVWGIIPFVPDPDGNIESDLFPGLDDGDGDTRILNPIVSARNVIRQRSTNNLLANARLEYRILNDLLFIARGGINRYHNEDESFYNSKTYQGYPWVSNLKGVNGSFNQANRKGWIFEGTFTYRKKTGRYGQLDAMAGISLKGLTTNGYGYSVFNIENEEYGLLGLKFGEPSSVISNLSKNLTASYFSRVNYNFRSKYLFTASLRADGSSKFSDNNRWGYFPSGAFAWQMGEEKFMKRIGFISQAKLRLSYGFTGNNSVRDFAQYPSIAFTDRYSFGNTSPKLVALTENLGDPHLKWESTTQTNIGYDLSLFHNKIGLTLDYYIKDTKDLLLNASLPTSTGYTRYFTNVGRIKNDGIEVTLQTINIKNRNFSWESNFNISFNRNKIVALADNQSTLFSSVHWTSNYNNSFLYLAQIGQSAASFYGYLWDGNYQYDDFDIKPDGGYVLKSSVPTNGTARANIKPGDIKYVDQNGDGVVNEQDRVVIGRALPIHIGGFNNNFRYKSFDLTVFFQWSYGNDIYNANRLVFEGNFGNREVNQYKTYVNRWTDENQNNTYFRVGGQGPSGMYSSRTIENGSYLRLKTLQLAYNFEKNLINKIGFIKGATLYVSAQNLFTWTAYSGMDPEVSVRNSTLTPGFDYSAYPRAKTYTFGLKADF